MLDKSKGYTVFTIFNTIFMLFIIFVTAYPVYYVVIASFSDPTELALYTKTLIFPLRPYTLSAYKMLMKNPMIIKGFMNTFFVLFIGLLFNLSLTAMGAYFLSLKNLLFKTPITFVIIFTMYFSGGLIPSYLNIRSLGLFDSLWSLILPSALTTSYMIIMKAAFMSVPDSLIESARLDGARHFMILWYVMIPLAIPTLMVMILFYGVGHWNSWFSASVYLQTREKYPLQLIMRNILISSQVHEMMGGVDLDETARMAELIKYALIVVSTLPILLLYPFLQKYFVKGVMIGAIKG